MYQQHGTKIIYKTFLFHKLSSKFNNYWEKKKRVTLKGDYV